MVKSIVKKSKPESFVPAGNFVPQKGDIILLDFTPQSGKEQAGKRPALVLSPKEYNGRVGLMLACPVTSQPKGYPFEVLLPKKLKTKGVILADHIKSLDWKSRNAYFLEKLPKESLREVVEKIGLLLTE